MTGSTALHTDRYELTMLDAALRDGTAHRRCVFELFGRRLPGGRRFGVVAGTGRLLSLIEDFRFGDDELRLPARRAGRGCRDPRVPGRLPVHRLDHRLPRGRTVLPRLPHPHDRGDVRRGGRARDPRPERAEPRLRRRDRRRPHEHRRRRPPARRDGLATRRRGIGGRRGARRLHHRIRRDEQSRGGAALGRPDHGNGCARVDAAARHARRRRSARRSTRSASTRRC